MTTTTSDFISPPVERTTSWLGPPLITLPRPAFDTACAELMRLVEARYAPTLIVGIPTGGLIVARSMVLSASSPLPVLPLTSRRASTGIKSRLPLLRHLLAVVPRPLVDLLRRLEHRLLAAPGARREVHRQINYPEAEAIAARLATSPQRSRVLVTDDAVDSGVTLATVLDLLRQLSPSGTEIRSAAITQTLDKPKVAPDFVLYRNTLCRFPWSFDAGL